MGDTPGAIPTNAKRLDLPFWLEYWKPLILAGATFVFGTVATAIGSGVFENPYIVGPLSAVHWHVLGKWQGITKVSGNWNALGMDRGKDGKPGPHRYQLHLDQIGERVLGTLKTAEFGDKRPAWRVSGYVRDQYLVLAYQSTASERASAGTLVLLKAPEGDAYAGLWIGNDCGLQKVTEDAFVLVRPDSDKPPEQRFGAFLARPEVQVLDTTCPQQRSAGG